MNSQLRTGLASSQFSDQFERGHSFSWKGEWQAGVKYFCNDEVTDFVTCDNTILVCRKTHTSDGANRPVIEGTDVAGELWEIALQNSADYSSGMCCDDIISSITANTDTLVEIISKLDDILDKMNSEPQPIISYSLEISADKTQIDINEHAILNAWYITKRDGVEVDRENVTNSADWSDGPDFYKGVAGSYTVTADYNERHASITIVVKDPVQRSLTISPTSLNDSGTISVHSVNCLWTCEKYVDWVIVSAMSGGDESRDIYTPITVTLTANPGQTSRSTTIKFTGSNGTVINCTITQSAPVVSNTIYYGFGNSAQYVYENGLKKENATSAMGRYTATNNEPTVYYFNLLIPASMTQPYDFTMGGAPMGMDTFNVRFDNKDYIHYQSYGRYAQGVTISMIAQE